MKPASAPAYDAFMGRWSRIVADRFVAWLAVAPQKRWLDVGCGTGALAGAILKSASPGEVWGVDPTGEYIARARMMHTDGRCHFLVGDAQALPAELPDFDAVVSGLMINLVPDPARAMAEMCRVTCAGGVVATYVWDFAEGMQVFRCLWDAARELDPAAEQMDQGILYTVCRPAPLRKLFVDAGLVQVEVETLDSPAVFADFDDYWTPFLSAQGHAPGYVMSLSEEHRSKLREHIRAAMPIRTDGSIHLNARAWLARGTKANPAE